MPIITMPDINGAFSLTVTARFDTVIGGTGQTVFDLAMARGKMTSCWPRSAIRQPWSLLFSSAVSAMRFLRMMQLSLGKRRNGLWLWMPPG